MFTCSKCGAEYQSFYNAQTHEKYCNGLVAKIKKGDYFYKGTSGTLYLALKDETQRGWVLCYAPEIHSAASVKYRFNTNHDDLTITEEGN